jgi:formate hydrogenlyase subunit 3/multisubunit Na+/H+ antiporter MnhD subunit
VATHKTKISELGGIGWRMPVTMGAFTIGALSIIGVPSTAGFITKWFVILGSLQAGLYPVLIVVLISTLLSAVYFLKIVRRAFFDPAGGQQDADASAAAASRIRTEPGPLLVVAGSATVDRSRHPDPGALSHGGAGVGAPGVLVRITAPASRRG